MCSDTVHVAVAVIANHKNQVLISKRPDDVHLGGCWEFPGGKVEEHESVEEALHRELKEELDIEISQYRPLIKITHHYKDKSVLLDVWEIIEYSGIVKGNEGQAIGWKIISELDVNDFPEADIPIIQAIKLPEYCLITGRFISENDFKNRLEQSINKGIRLVQCRITNEYIKTHGSDLIIKIIQQAEVLCKEKNTTLMLNCPDEIKSSIENVHLNSKKLMACKTRPECKMLSASCHNNAELLKATELGVNFVFLSPVQATSSHPDAIPLGWESFSEIIKDVNIPVYALGGVSKQDLMDARNAGAQGIAAISAFW